jgi:hypothetical protein
MNTIQKIILLALGVGFELILTVGAVALLALWGVK